MTISSVLPLSSSFPSACVERIKEVWKRIHDFVMGIIESIKKCFSPSQGSSSLNGRSIQGPLNLISFYRGTEANNNGVTLNQILGWDDAQLESVHNYIQWLFPLDSATPHNPTAPILDTTTIHTFRGDPALKAQLLRSFRRMLAFYGLQMNEATKVIARALTFNARAGVWLMSPAGHHNFLRITRIIRSMNCLGLADYSAPLLAIMRDIARHEGNGIISQATLTFWENAARLTG